MTAWGSPRWEAFPSPLVFRVTPERDYRVAVVHFYLVPIFHVNTSMSGAWFFPTSSVSLKGPHPQSHKWELNSSGRRHGILRLLHG